jgi:DNA-binding transcriptional regulator YhcF (GntR family)
VNRRRSECLYEHWCRARPSPTRVWKRLAVVSGFICPASRRFRSRRGTFSWWLGLREARNDASITVVMNSVKRSSGRGEALPFSRVDRREQTLLHEQVAAEIRRAIANGEAKPGERIPQAKDLAAVLGVNVNTVLRAFRLLRDEGLLEVGRGRATTVTGNADQSAVLTKTKELVAFARARGYKRNELIAMLQGLP